MPRTPEPRILLAFESLAPLEVTVMLANARALRQAALAGTMQPLLRGKNLGLLRNAADADRGGDGEAEFFRGAAADLGAKVADIRAGLSESTAAQEIQHTARLLGRLYDAVACQGLPRAIVQQVSVAAGVPVLDGIASAEHPTARLAELLGAEATAEENRRYMLQAVLLSAVS
jgi:ornithine carbamoyltransferase